MLMLVHNKNTLINILSTSMFINVDSKPLRQLVDTRIILITEISRPIINVMKKIIFICIVCE